MLKILKPLLDRTKRSFPGKKENRHSSKHSKSKSSAKRPTPKQEWKKMVDSHLRTLRLPPDDMLPEISSKHWHALHVPYAARGVEMDRLFHELISRFARHDADLADLRQTLPAMPLEARFYQMEKIHDLHPNQ